MAAIFRSTGNNTILRRCLTNTTSTINNVAQRRSYHLSLRNTNAAAAAGHHHHAPPPPMPPFARSPPAFEHVSTPGYTILVWSYIYIYSESILIFFRLPMLTHSSLRIEIVYGMMVLRRSLH